MDLYEKRRTRLCEWMRSHGVDVALFGEPRTFLYLTGAVISPAERFIGLLLDARDGRHLAVAPKLEALNMRGCAVEQCLYEDGADPLEILHPKMRGRKVGVQMGGGFQEHYSMALGKRLFQAYGLEMADMTDVVDEMRLSKDEEELMALRASADRLCRMFAFIRERLAPGKAELELSMEMFAETYRLGGTDYMIPCILSGPAAASPHGQSSGKLLQRGEQVLIDCSIDYKGYWADMSRTFFLGEPTPKMREVFQVLLEAQQAAIEAVKIGEPICGIDQAARRVIEKAGYGPYFTHRVGHGIGLSIHETPSVDGRNQNPILKGMYHSVEPGIYIPGEFGMRIEDDVYASESGPIVLTDQMRKDLDYMILQSKPPAKPEA